MLVSPVSPPQHPVQPLAASTQTPEVGGAAQAVSLSAGIGASGDLDLFAAATFYREQANELARLSQQSGNYETVTLSDSEIKSLRNAGVPIDAFLKQYGQKLGSREFGMLSDLIMKSLEKPGGFASSDAAPTSPTAATATVAARAYV
ncbi:hypothetical protein [Cupriavidus gilardii]|uniref:Uncharacterized protein n=1 Tax=Cupriavidus gilardii TaxID=82541 RepID=A0A849BGE3_9BURK|nr:hypothetical protein [Cupriavidus gilardii]QQE06729.1 hypothetical protein IC580_13605 [Cupriavidus sp. ISTL7]KAB0594018.1 hypothetical protein F7Q96_23585 [Cupriavidus gilardii]MCT9016083.1 hypothetical protein [Cupriavidus gilardii]MCT9055853.1 hypothetical protein [Cupriavidus gilardii]NNH13164.1 hypothetical protein [Cupriavidus gilardii]